MSLAVKEHVKEGKIVTYSGKIVELFNPQPDMFDIDDIAQGLSNSVRFGGQISTFYSIAQHSYNVSKRLPKEKALWGLLHDASEAYIQDLITPLKYNIPLYRDVEASLMKAIATKFMLPKDFLVELDNKDSDLKKADKAQFEWEWENLKVNSGVRGWDPKTAKRMFMYEYTVLSTEEVPTACF